MTLSDVERRCRGIALTDVSLKYEDCDEQRNEMNISDLIIVSVDDHISEPPVTFDKHLSDEALATAPQFTTAAEGTDYWEYQRQVIPSVGLNAVVDRVPEE